MKKTIVILAITVIFLGCSSNVMGRSGFFIGLQGGYSAQKPGLPDFEFKTDTSFLYGVRLGLKFLMIAVELNYFQAAHNLELKEYFTFSWGGKEIDYNYLGANLKFFFPFLVFQPYITGGYGYYTADIKTIGKNTDKGLNGGLGIEIHLGSKFSLLVEGKYHHVSLDIDQLELKIGDWTLSGGLNFYF